MNKKLSLQILHTLIQSKEPVTVKFIADTTKKSTRTIRTYLKEIEKILEGEDVFIIKKPNVGIYLKADNEKRSRLKEKYLFNLDKGQMYDAKYRKQYILEILLVNKFVYTMQMFADDLFCSKSTIAKDFKLVDDWLTGNNLQLVRNKSRGFSIEGKEHDIRRALKIFIETTNQQEKYSKINCLNNVDYRISEKNFSKFEDFFKDIDLFFVQNLINEAEKEIGVIFTDQAFINLFTHLLIMIKRVKENKEIKMTKEFNIKYKKSELYPISIKIINLIAEKFFIHIPEDEACYICLHFMGAKIHKNISNENYLEILKTQDEFYVNLAKEIINVTGDILGIDFSGDSILLTSLVVHIRPVIVRLENGLKLDNPMLDVIKREYTSIFCASWIAGTVFEKVCGLIINEDEVAYITMHIAAAMERMNNKIKAVVVCSSGIGTAQWIKIKLMKEMKNIEVQQVISVNQLTDDVIENCDIIVSTIPFPIKSSKTVYVSTMLNNEDINEIMATISRIKINGSYEKEKNIHKSEYLALITEDFCFVEKEVLSFTNLIKKYGALLIKSKYGKEGFIESVLEREKISSTYLGKGIIIPHPAIDYVNESKILVIKLNEPIFYKNEIIDIIFMLCLKIEGYGIATDIFSEFYNILNDEQFLQKLKKTNESNIINNMLRRFNYGRTRGSRIN